MCIWKLDHHIWFFVGNMDTPSGAPLREAYSGTAWPHRRPAEGDSKKSPPCWYYKWLQPSVPHHPITLHPILSHQEVCLPSGFPLNTYVGLVWYNMSYNVNTSWRICWWSLFPKNLVWDHPGQFHLRVVNILSLSTNHLLITAQSYSSGPDDDRSLPPLHPPADGDRHSPSLNRPNNYLSTKDPLHVAFLSSSRGYQVKNTNACPMHWVKAWVWIK